MTITNRPPTTGHRPPILKLAVIVSLAVTLPLLVRADSSTAPAPRFEIKLPAGISYDLWSYYIPKNNPVTAEKVKLGEHLYFDKRLSADGTVSCATCHDPKHAFGDGQAFSKGIRGQLGGRSAPTVINRAYSLDQFWDGRAKTLEEQAKGPIANPVEMGQPHDACEKCVGEIAGYRKRFKAVFGTDQVTIDLIAKAIATFERTVLSGNSAYDRFKAGKKDALSESQQRGMNIFFSNHA